MAAPSVTIGFRQEVLDISLDRLVALKEIEPRCSGSRKYKQLRASLEHVGLVEPFAVYPRDDQCFLVINGNLRLHILRELNFKKVRCTVALDDEAYTYNKRVNALSPITEHFMILKAIANGVTAERIADGLNVDVKAIQLRRNLLDGICPEAVELLKDKRLSSRIFGYLRKMKPLRQIEAGELMVAGKNYSIPFAAAILGVTRQDQLVRPEKEAEKAETGPLTTLLEDTTDGLVVDLATARRNYGTDVLTLSVICRCLEKVVQNVEVSRYLKRNHSGVLIELEDLLVHVNAERTASR